MSLEIIMGSMFSGKSTELIRRIRLQQVMGRSVRVVNHALDDRKGCLEAVRTHDATEFRAVKYPTLEKFMFDGVDTVAVDETQFFGNLREWVEYGLSEGKHIILAGLDGDFKQHKFGELLDVVPLADNVTKLRALCMFCKDGTPGPFTYRNPGVGRGEQVLVAAEDCYKAVCRKCLTAAHHLY
jgi:thymidine kinase